MKFSWSAFLVGFAVFTFVVRLAFMLYLYFSVDQFSEDGKYGQLSMAVELSLWAGIALAAVVVGFAYPAYRMRKQ